MTKDPREDPAALAGIVMKTCLVDEMSESNVDSKERHCVGCFLVLPFDDNNFVDEDDEDDDDVCVVGFVGVFSLSLRLY